MKQLSSWGKANPLLSRTIIVLAYILLVADAAFLGFCAFAQDLVLPHYWFQILGLIFFGAYFFYPIKKARDGWFRYTYNRQKIMDGLLVGSFALAMMVHTNYLGFYQPESTFPRAGQKMLVAIGAPQQLENPPAEKGKSSLLNQIKESRRDLRQKIKTELRELRDYYKAQGDAAGQKAANTLLIIAAILGFLALLFTIIILSCSVACSGNEGLAIVLAALGTLGSILLFVVVLKGIARRKRAMSAG